MDSTYTEVTSGRTMAETLHEDVKDIITNISAKDAVFIASIGKAKATNTLHDWLSDTDRDPAANKAVEGADAVDVDVDVPDRLRNYTQILVDAFKVSGSMKAVNPIGRKSHMAYRLAKSMKYVAKCIDYAAINNATSAAGSATVARQMKGMEGWITTNDDSFASAADYTESKFLDQAQNCFDAGGNPNTLLVTSGVSKDIGAWDQSNRITINATQESKKLVMAVATLETSFGIVRVLISRNISGTTTSTVYLYDPAMWKLATLRPTFTKPLAVTGDAQRYQVVWEGTLEALAEASASKCGLTNN